MQKYKFYIPAILPSSGCKEDLKGKIMNEIFQNFATRAWNNKNIQERKDKFPISKILVSSS